MPKGLEEEFPKIRESLRYQVHRLMEHGVLLSVDQIFELTRFRDKNFRPYVIPLERETKKIIQKNRGEIWMIPGDVDFLIKILGLQSKHPFDL